MGFLLQFTETERLLIKILEIIQLGVILCSHGGGPGTNLMYSV